MALVLGLATGLSACGSGGSGVTSASLATLVSNQEHYDGHAVRTEGRFRAFTDPDGSTYVVVEDPDANRVLVEPRSAAERFVGARATVIGCFTSSPTSDRTLRAWSIERLGRGTPSRVRLRSAHSCTPTNHEVA